MVRQEMQRGLELRVPIAVDIGSGANWLAAHR
jgi:DNA polymerase I-like protein with 3'-5' exonuclease and polymerase domains